MSWFTYDEQGQAMWLTLSGQLYEQQLQGTLMRYTGPALGTDWDQKQVKGIPAGQATFVLHDDQLSGTFDYQVNGIKGQLALQPFYPGPSNQLDGFWWQPKTSGQGVQIYHKGDYLFGVAYLYDKTGQATWVTFQGCLTGNLFEAALQRFTGPRLGNRWDATQVKAQAVGSIQLRLIGIIREVIGVRSLTGIELNLLSLN